MSSSSDVERSRACRATILELAHSVHKGHIGSALSISDIVDTTLDFVRGLGTQDPARDRFVLSKGHAAMALYAALHRRGLMTDSDLAGYCKDGSPIATHPHAATAGIDFSTGSLGQGITFAVGSALAAVLKGSGSRTFCVLSDSELDEGSTWEAALFAAHHRLANLTVLLDFNRQQALGMTDDVLSLRGVPDAWAEIGWNVDTTDGHDMARIRSSLDRAIASELPNLIVCQTNSGSGVSFMERRVEWHYLPMSDEQYSQAVTEIGQR